MEPDVDDAAVSASTLFAWLAAQPPQHTAARAEALFARLLDRAGQSRVASSVHACAKLCGFVQYCAREDSQMRNWAYQPTTTLRLFRFYMEWNEKDQHRSLRLVLDLVAQLVMHQPDAGVRTALRAEILQALVAVVAHTATRPLVKSAIGSLHYLLGKGVYGYEEVAEAYSYASEIQFVQSGASRDDPLAVWRRLVDDLFAWMTLHYVCPVAGKLLVAVFAYLHGAVDEDGQPVYPDFTVHVWLQWLRAGLAAHPGILEDVKLYFFIPLFKADRASSLQLLEALNRAEATKDTEGTPPAAVLQLAALEVGKKAGLVDDPGLSLSLKPAKPVNKKSQTPPITLNELVLDDVLGQAAADVRSLALSLLVSSQSTTKPYSAAALALLRRYLPAFHAESDAKFRYELLAHTRDMAVRLKSAIQLMQKWRQANASDTKSEAVQTALADHEAFLSWYLAFLRAELAPTASYQRHFTALKATAWLLRQRRDVAGAVSGSDNAANAAANAAADPTLDHDLARRLFRDTAWVRCVLDRIMDPFDDVRETAAALLALAPGGDVSLAATLTAFTARADARASLTARQDHADGAARCHGLLCAWAAPSHHDQRAVLLRVLDVLERKIATADADLAAAAVTAPVHGEFAAIRYIWGVLVKGRYDDEEDVTCLHAAQARIVACCDRIWRIVQHVLCDDSPEGHLLEGDQASATTLLDSKDLLSYSFRAINEASNTMRAIVAPLRFSRVQGMLLPDRAVFAAIGHLSFAQLAALRHRGALTTVAQTFTLCCQLARDPLVTTTPPLVTTWYEGTLDCIRSQGSTTRRSAGIPSLFAGILASNAAAPTFDDAMRTVCDIAQQPPPANSTTADNPHLPQVHAFNCLRDVFRSSLLSKRAERLLPACLQLAAASLRADVWAIRNCGLLLLRSLIDCLFGTGESKASLESGWDGRTIRVSFNKYPSLPGVLLGLLDADDGQTATQQAAAESVFPALDIIRRAGAPPDTDTNHPHRPALYRAVVHYLGSTLWHVREMAARTLCSFLIVQDDWPAALQALFLPEDASTNRLHGSLLAVRFAVARIAELHPADDVAPHLPRLAAWLDALARANNGLNICPDVRAAYLEARNTICHLAIDFGLPLADFVLPDDECADHVSPPQSALLVAQSVLHTNYAAAAARNDRAALETLLSRVAVTDPDTATRLLDAVPHAWSAANDNSTTTTTTAWLATVYLRVAHESRAAPLVRAAALRHLADALDCLLRPAQQPSLLPSADALVRLWTSLARADTINPTLSWAILRVSGPIMAALQSPPNTPPLSIPAWAAMLKAAGSDDQTYDTRLAAADALRSFALAGTLTTLTTLPPADLLPVVACIYDSLNDDDDEIRDVAADAAAAVLGKPLIPGEAARQLPMWMAAHLGPQHEHMPDFAAQAAARMLGHTTSLPPSSWPSAADLLNDALHFDDALFLVEEQNLFIDEVREAERWGHVVQHLYPTHNQHGLAAWIADGLDALVRRLNDNTATDGPLGWTAAPSVFAVCARLLVGATSILRSGATQGPEERRLQALLDDFCQAGEAAQIHGLLLAMAKV